MSILLQILLLMIKNILKPTLLSTIGIIAISTALISCSSKDFFKKNFVTNCKKQLLLAAPNVKDAQAEKYCVCAAEKSIIAFTMEELKKIDKNPNGLDAATNAKFMSVIEPCVNELKQEIEQAQSTTH
jgi:hypothetical protein